MDEPTLELILDLLNYGLQSRALLAKKYGISERTMRRRIEDMISNGYIRPVVAPNLMRLGYKAWARIGIKVAPGYLDQVARELVAHPSVYWVVYCLGRFDIMISVYFDAMDKLANFVNSELIKIKGIQDMETILQVSPRKYLHFLWPVPVLSEDKGAGRTDDGLSNDQAYKLQEAERRILDILVAEGPARPRSLVAKLGMGENTIRKYMRAMTQNEVYKIETACMADVLEYRTHAYIGINIHDQSPHQIIESIIANPAVYTASATLGKYNLLIGVRFSNRDLLNGFISEFLPSIPGITSIETFLLVRLLKLWNVTWPIR